MNMNSIVLVRMVELWHLMVMVMMKLMHRLF